MKCLWDSALGLFDTKPLFLTIMHTALIWLLSIICYTHRKHLLPSTFIGDSFKPEPFPSADTDISTFRYLCPWSVLAIHLYSHMSGFEITESCSISKTLNSDTSLSHPNHRYLLFLDPSAAFLLICPLLPLLLCLISLVSIAQHLNNSFAKLFCLCSSSGTAESCWRKAFTRKDLCLCKCWVMPV